MKTVKKSVKHPARSRTSPRTTRIARRVVKAPRSNVLPARGWPWQATTSFFCGVARKGGEKLGIYITSGDGYEYAVAALTASGAAATAQATAQDVLDHHAHHLVGTFGSLDGAMTAAEAYAKSWQRGKTKHPAECACDEIDAPQIGSPSSEVLVPPMLVIGIDDGSLSKHFMEHLRLVISDKGEVVKNTYGDRTPEAIGPSVLAAVQHVCRDREAARTAATTGQPS